MNDELIWKSDARRAILKMAPNLAFSINGIHPVANAHIQKEAILEERIVDHAFPSYTVFECSICDARNEEHHNFCCICGAKFKEVKYVRMD